MVQFTVGNAVQYYSTSHGVWIDALVEDVRDSGDVQVSCKKGYWMTPAEQLQRLRASPDAGAGPTPAAAAAVSSGADPAAEASGAAGAGAARAGGGYPAAGKAGEAAAAPGMPAAAPRCADQGGDWGVEQAIGLGKHGAEGLGPWAKVLDKATVSSVHVAVERLNQGALQCTEDFCVIYSASSQGYLRDMCGVHELVAEDPRMLTLDLENFRADFGGTLWRLFGHLYRGAPPQEVMQLVRRAAPVDTSRWSPSLRLAFPYVAADELTNRTQALKAWRELVEQGDEDALKVVGLVEQLGYSRNQSLDARLRVEGGSG